MNLSIKEQEYSNSLIRKASIFENVRLNNVKLFKVQKKLRFLYLAIFLLLNGVLIYFLIDNYYFSNNNELNQIIKETDHVILNLKVERSIDNTLKKLERENLTNYIIESYNFIVSGLSKTALNYKNGEIQLEDVENFFFYGYGEVGNNHQKFSFIFDTGSSDLWVPSTKCTSDACHKKNLYDSTKSSTYVKDGGSVILNYGSGTVSGFYSNDLVYLADMSLTYKFIEITDVDKLEPTYSNSEFDGIIGLGWKNLSTSKTSPIVVELKNQNKIDHALFTFYLPAHAKDVGYLTIGGIEERFYQGDIVYEKLTREFYWEINLSAKFGKNTLENVRSIVDSGTSIICGPSDFLLKFFKDVNIIRVPSLPLFVTQCNNTNLPVLEFQSGNNKYTLEPEFYMEPLNDSSTLCIILIAPINLGDGDIIILGDPFMRKYFTVFDYENDRVGFAEGKRFN